MDYSIYYARFHPDSEAHFDWMAEYMKGMLSPLLPSDLSASVLDIGCGYGFALRALQKLEFVNI
jgi:SAM-dependent methyltransferase